MKRFHMLACAAMLAATSLATAQPMVYNQESGASEVEFYLSNTGVFGLNMQANSAGFVYPRGKANAYLFGGGLWFGAQKKMLGAIQKLTFITYNPNSGASWATPGEIKPPNAVGEAEPRLYRSIDYDHTTGECTLRDRFYPNWPLWIPTGATITPSNPGHFERYDSERKAGTAYSGPAFLQGIDEQFTARFHDGDVDRYEIVDANERSRYPIGLQVQQNVYGWANGKYKGVVVVQYMIVNTSTDTLYNCVVGQASDPDLGVTSNDHVRYYEERPELRAAYAWTDRELRAPANEVEYGALAMALVEGPVTDDRGFIDNSDRRGFAQRGRLGAFPNWTIEVDPRTAAERYDFMTSGKFATDMGPGDQRALLASTKFNMAPGDTCHFTMAYAVLDRVPEMGKTKEKEDGSHVIAGGSLKAEQLESLVESLTADYYVRDMFNSVASAPVTGSAAVRTAAAVPNPAIDHATLRFTLDGRSKVAIRLTNTLGETVLVREPGMLEAGSHDERIELASLPAGIYVAAIESESGTQIAKVTVSR